MRAPSIQRFNQILCSVEFDLSAHRFDSRAYVRREERPVREREREQPWLYRARAIFACPVFEFADIGGIAAQLAGFKRLRNRCFIHHRTSRRIDEQSAARQLREPVRIDHGQR